MPYKKWLGNGSMLYGNYADESEKAVIWNWYTKDGKLIKKEHRYLKNNGFVVPEQLVDKNTSFLQKKLQEKEEQGAGGKDW